MPGEKTPMARKDEKTKDIEANIKKLESLADDFQEVSEIAVELKYNPQEHKDKTRSEIALFFVKAYVALIIFIFVAVFTYNLVLLTINRESFVLDIKDIFPLVIGTVGTLLGFVLGYYFKSQERE